jgi:hypothetical protein
VSVGLTGVSAGLAHIYGHPSKADHRSSDDGNHRSRTASESTPIQRRCRAGPGPAQPQRHLPGRRRTDRTRTGSRPRVALAQLIPEALAMPIQVVGLGPTAIPGMPWALREIALTLRPVTGSQPLRPSLPVHHPPVVRRAPNPPLPQGSPTIQPSHPPTIGLFPRLPALRPSRPPIT